VTIKIKRGQDFLLQLTNKYHGCIRAVMFYFRIPFRSNIFKRGGTRYTEADQEHIGLQKRNAQLKQGYSGI